ncbi:MAG: twin-arginine translocase TatA/TatE family subunit [Pseudomonadota bacterium]
MVPGWQQLLLVLVIVLVLFGGRGRISSLMGDMAKGIRSFRKGLAEDDGSEEQTDKPGALEAQNNDTHQASVTEPTGETTKTR